ncbi:ABC transporter substrate-binding protein [Actinoallomurus sp. NPDC052274]|uniref:ABC transporter substrate-binding protein n=1 Tax=Actinoallomurus sp. NPDC052274 TaxID=3155420 RepID=UPI003446D4E5
MVTAPPTTLWFTRCPVPTATGIAADRGWLAAEFARDGVTVRSLQEADAEGVRGEHFRHRLATLIREGGNVPALWARSTGAPTRLIGLTWIEERQVIVGRPDSGVEGPADLKGRRLAVPRRAIEIDFWRAMALRGFDGALAQAGLSLDDCELVELAGDRPGQWETELAALRDGRVDAVYTKGAVAVETAARYGAEVAIDLDALPDPRSRINNGTPRPITVDQRLLDDHPELVVRFLAVLLGAADWAKDHAAEVGRILQAETGSGPVGVAAAYRGDYHRHLHATLDDDRLALLAEQEDFLRRHGFHDAPVDVTAWADPAPLTEARKLTAGLPFITEEQP